MILLMLFSSRGRRVHNCDAKTADSIPAPFAFAAPPCTEAGRSVPMLHTGTNQNFVSSDYRCHGSIQRPHVAVWNPHGF